MEMWGEDRWGECRVGREEKRRRMMGMGMGMGTRNERQKGGIGGVNG